jgi:DnaT-like ssDNA binding protein
MPTAAMSPTVEGVLDCTLSLETSNSYCNTEYCDGYWADHFDTTKAAQWAALSDAQKQRLLIRACATLDTLRFTVPHTLPEYALTYNRRTRTVMDMNLTRDPVKYYYYQKLQFPRNLDVYVETGPYGTTYIPDNVLDAQCEQALYTLNFDESAIASRMQGITMEKLGLGKQAVEITQEFGSGIGTALSPTAYDFVRSLVVRGGRMQRS